MGAPWLKVLLLMSESKGLKLQSEHKFRRCPFAPANDRRLIFGRTTSERQQRGLLNYCKFDEAQKLLPGRWRLRLPLNSSEKSSVLPSIFALLINLGKRQEVLDARCSDPTDLGEQTMIKHRRRIKQTAPLRERLQQFAEQSRTAAARLPVGNERKQVMAKVALAEHAIELEGWLASRDLRPPT